MASTVIRRIGIDPTYQGIISAMGAGALWGLVFLAPELARAFTPLELSIGRYLAYGGIALLLIAPRWSAVTSMLTRRDWLTLGWLGLMGNTVYYFLLSNAVQTGGIAMTTIIIGFIPVSITVIGSLERGAVRLSALAPSLALCAAGAACIGWQALNSTGSGSGGSSLIGFLCALGALASWTAFAVSNSRSLARLKRISVHDWSLLTGLSAGAQALLLVPIALLAGSFQHDADGWLQFAGVSIGVALLASIAGNALWNRTSRLLPLTLSGQLILFETMFGLLYAFTWEQRLPTFFEILAFVFLIAGVTSCLAAHRQPAGKAKSCAPSH